MKTRAIVLFLLPLLAMAGPAHSQVQTLPGPELNASVWGWANLGLKITARENAVLRRFLFHNQGRADTVVLLDAEGSLVGEHHYGGGEPVHPVDAGWDLRAGETYYLLSVDRDNGTWASYSDFPVANDHIQVDGVVGDGAFYTFIWFNFNSLETTASAAALAVAVDVRPGSAVNPLNLRSRGKVPVAVLSDAGFDATALLADSLQLAGAGVALRRNGRPLARRTDVNGDGLDDVLALFRTADILPELIVDGWIPLTGVTRDGTSVEGGDTVRLVPRGRGRAMR